jgi:anti-sigma-K factor RskA
MNESDQVAKLAALGAQMTYVVEAVADLRRMIQGMSEKFVQQAAHDAAMNDVHRRLASLELAEKEGGFMGSAKKWREVAMTVTAILAAIAAMAYVLRSWPGVQ